MSTDVDAVIAALRIVLQEVERQTRAETFEIHIVNKWVRQLPGAWTGRWRQLKLEPRWAGSPSAYREAVLMHVRSTLAYLETNRDSIAARRLRWPARKKAKAAVSQGTDTARKEAPSERSAPRPKWVH